MTPLTKTTPLPSTDEDRRLAALQAMALLDSEPEGAFDALVALTAQRFDCPVSMLNLIDRDRQWVKAKVGTDITETDRDVAFCDHTIRGSEPMVIEDATQDARFATNPLVTGGPGIRFYAGAPIHVTDDHGRHAIGTLCLIDAKPRTMTPDQVDALAHVTVIVETLISSRAAALEAIAIAEAVQAQARQLRRQENVFRQVERMTMIGSWRLDLQTESVTWSDGVYRIHELSPDEQPNLHGALDYYPPRDRAAITEALTGTIETGTPYETEVDFITAKGKRRRVRSRGELEIENGRAVAVVGVFQDVTDRHRVERKLRESASTDEVTRIANRAEFNRVLEAELQAARQGKPIVLALIDLDDFKNTNDTFGHVAGDDVLRAVGQRLRAPYLHGSFAARLGGDEFALLLTDPDLVADAPAVIGKLLELLKTPVQSRDVLLPVSGTIGSARPGPGAETVRDLMHAADIALYTAKRNRRGTAHAYVPPALAAG
jgi:diguanylate cyclase (GGDEF)-like protein/PAS domain S-box-containing protein